MRRSVLLDTGPLLALIDERDRHHAWVRSEFAEIEPPLLTCEAALTESCFLAQRELGRIDAVWGLLERGVVHMTFSLEEHWTHVSVLMRHYANVPMSLADACLVRMSDLTADCVVLTLDSDFRVYRRHGRKQIPLLIPPTRIVIAHVLPAGMGGHRVLLKRQAVDALAEAAYDGQGGRIDEAVAELGDVPRFGAGVGGTCQAAQGQKQRKKHGSVSVHGER